MVYITVQDYYDFQAEHRNGILGSLSRKYHAIGPLLIKVEGLVVQTNTGKSRQLAHYYEYWERKVFDALVKVSCVHRYFECLSIMQVMVHLQCIHTCSYMCINDSVRSVQGIYCFIYHSLTLCILQMVMNNMQYYNVLLLSGIPLFIVGAILSPPEISLHPHGPELLNMMMQAVIDIVER